jgi:hypothetical protein
MQQQQQQCTVKLGYNELGYNELGYNEHSVITNEYFGPKCKLTAQIDPVITNGFGRSRAVRYNRVSLYFKLFFNESNLAKSSDSSVKKHGLGYHSFNLR